MVATRTDATAPTNNNGSSTNSMMSSEPITVGRTVEVARRTWPGINKPGGVARVVALHMVDGGNIPSSVSVQYIVGGGREKNVPIQYVQLAPQYEQAPSTSSLRDRNRLLGRCTRCGSLRTDCGSCDWATEVEVAEDTTTTTTTTTTNSSKPKRQTNKRRANSRRNNQNILEFSSSSSSSSEEENNNDDFSSENDDDAVLLKELVAKNQGRYQSYKRMQQRRKLLQFSDSSSSSSEDDEEKQTARVENQQRKEKRSRQLQEFWKGLSSSDSSSSEEEEEHIIAPKRRTIQKLSLLPMSKSRKRSRQKKHMTKKVSQPFSRRRKTISAMMGSTASSIDNGSENNKRGEGPTSAVDQSQMETPSKTPEKALNVDEDPDIGEVEESESPGFEPQPDWSPQSESPPTPPSASQSQRPDTPERYGYDPNEALKGGNRNDSSTLALSQFIQPEGEADCLPDEMMDQTAQLQFSELPAFLEELTTRMQDDLLPDAKLTVARLEREYKNNPPIDEFEAKCQQTWLELRDSLVRNGVDQWIVALRRLESAKEYRKVKHQLSLQERRQRRRVLELQELQIDALEEEVEQVMKKLKQLLRSLDSSQEYYSDSALDSGSASDSSGDGSDRNDQYETQDLIPLNDLARSLPDADSPGPFDPHQYAQRVRSSKPKPQGRIKQSSAKQTSKSSRKQKGTSKNSKRPSNDLASFIVDDLGDSRRSKKKRRSEDTSDASRFVDEEASSRKRHSLSHGEDRNETDKNSKAQKKSSSAKSSSRASHQAVSQTVGVDNDDFFEETFSLGDNRNENEPPTFNLFGQLDSFLGKRSNSSMEDISTSERAGSRRHDRAPILDRMQRFLDANSSNALDLSTSSDREKALNNQSTSFHSQRNQSLEACRQQADNPEREPPLSSESFGTPCSSIRAEHILAFDTRMRRQLAADSSQEMIPEARMTDLCLRLRQCYPRDVSGVSKILSKIKSALGQAPMDPSCGASDFLKTSVGLLNTHGKSTLLEMISTENTNFSIHIRLLTEVVYVTELGLEVTLRPSDGLVYQIFSQEGGRKFVRYLTLQLVECVLAVINPMPWKLQVRNASKVLSLLWSLKEALGKISCLAEVASCCLSQELGCQKWRMSESKEAAFLSCLSRHDWKSFLVSAKYPQSPSDIRIVALGKSLPRIEVESFWSLLAFVGVPSTKDEEKSMARWQLISKLFSSGVLSGQSDESSHCGNPPSRDQVSACDRELSLLSTLLASGRLGTIPGTDSILGNLIRRAIYLQHDELLYNSEYAESFFNQMKVSKGAKKRIDHIWESTGLSRIYALSSVKVYEANNKQLTEQVCWSSDTLRLFGSILPSPGIIGSCLRLLSAWIEYIPNKKARQTRFFKSIQAVVKDLTQKATKTELQESSSNQNSEEQHEQSFEEAFPMQSRELGTDEASDPSGCFLAEAASFLRIFPSLCASVLTPPESTLSYVIEIASVIEVWESLSSQAMKIRHQILLQGMGMAERPVDAKVDPLRLLIAGKVMTFITLLQLDVSPWKISDGTEFTRVVQCELSPQHQFHEHLEFLVTSLFACIDCLCDQNHNATIVDIMTKLFRNAAVIFTHASAVLTSGQGNLRSSIRHLGKAILTRVGVTVSKCYMSITSRDEVFDNDSILIRAFLAMLRSMATLRSASMNNRLSDTSHSEGRQCEKVHECEDDYFGGIDDSAFASLDLDELDGLDRSSSTSHETEAIMTLLKSLITSLEESKPSNRFSLVHGTSAASTVSMDDYKVARLWKPLIEKNVDKICKCIVALIVVSKDPSLDKIVNVFLTETFQPRVCDDDNGDGVYARLIGSSITSEVCSLAETNDKCQNILRCFSEGIIYNSIAELLDSGRVEALPSCNLDAIREAAGEEAEQHALMLLDLFNKDSSSTKGDNVGRLLESVNRGSNRKRTQFWEALKTVGRNLSKLVNSDEQSGCLSQLGVIFEIEEPDLKSGKVEEFELVCIESEVFKTLRVVRGIISAVARTNRDCSLTFERITAFILSTTFSQTIRLTQSLQYRDDVDASAGRKDSLQDFRRAKLQELLACYCDLSMSVLSWILREKQEATIQCDQWNSFVEQSRDRFLCPILSSQSNDLVSAMSNVISAAESVFLKPTRRSQSWIRVSPERSRYLRQLFTKIIRRSRELMIHVAGENEDRRPNNLIHAIVASAYSDLLPQENLSNYLRAIGSSFHYSFPKVTFENIPSSPLSQAIDEYFFLMDGSLPTTSEGICQSMNQAKLYALKNLIVPRLSHMKTDLSTKERALILLREIFKGDDSERIRGLYERSNIDIFVSLARSLDITLQEALSRPRVPDEIIGQLFLVVRVVSLVRVKTADREEDTMSMIHWSKINASSLLPNRCFELTRDWPKEELQASYLWAFFSWLDSLAQMFAHESETNLSMLSSIRDLLKPGRFEASPSSIGGKEDSEMWMGCCRQIEQLLFPSRKISGINVINKYAKQSDSLVDEEMVESWRPSSSVRRRAKEFMTEIISIAT